MAEQEPQTADGDDDAEKRRRRRRLAEVFGDVLPETTSDERGGEAGGDREAWYRENRPPHHGG
ncbi:hypothetical protein BBK82_10865 [Lentzea guizhouensis]|uniref:Uncharacterized protein n=1 Tax=Lentzea guizhouensis TaxID=1586287 RepID=A0A1B2HFI6_9PSEU|nr:hypothetical protein [Lentzea guizhouensis]ANZ36494.1 hypothetical protein BBK82_10865 [Lentzea guizhouensis]